ncbi:hypothetical protein GTO91_05645 [Heliobacterium undosum]|uniref:Uncharacterized protein n=1 Tax=Heliomicrobium undosum TaxID=121734 RepID=A0A845L3L9_9FIRM|nr:hypothetical protein [Heliomicrobium undosum]MZP29190.1 hypothetical protein [Heliomicrobium undosum]
MSQPPTQRQLRWIQMLEKQTGLLLSELDMTALKEKKAPETTEQAGDIKKAFDLLCAFLQEVVLARDNHLTDVHLHETTREGVAVLSEFYDVPQNILEIALSQLPTQQPLH